MRYLILGILFLLTACGQRETKKEIDKVGHIKNLIKTIGFLELPFTYDIAESAVNPKYSMDHNSMDTLFFDSGQFEGALPDTTNFYCILYYQSGDSLYPFLTTIDKNGNVIDTQNIGIGYCGGMLTEIEQCIDQVTISENMDLDLLYKAIGTAEDDSAHQAVKICNTIVGAGKIHENGKISIIKTESEDCDKDRG
jgi:hypothetical protein